MLAGNVDPVGRMGTTHRAINGVALLDCVSAAQRHRSGILSVPATNAEYRPRVRCAGTDDGRENRYGTGDRGLRPMRYGTPGFAPPFRGI